MRTLVLVLAALAVADCRRLKEEVRQAGGPAPTPGHQSCEHNHHSPALPRWPLNPCPLLLARPLVPQAPAQSPTPQNATAIEHRSLAPVPMMEAGNATAPAADNSTLPSPAPAAASPSPAASNSSTTPANVSQPEQQQVEQASSQPPLLGAGPSLGAANDVATLQDFVIDLLKGWQQTERKYNLFV